VDEQLAENIEIAASVAFPPGIKWTQVMIGQLFYPFKNVNARRFPILSCLSLSFTFFVLIECLFFKNIF